MGGKHIGAGKHLFLYIACLILMYGCASTGETDRRPTAREKLLQSQKLIARGDFQGALKLNQAVYARYEKRPPGDEALFNIGLIYAHYGNQDRSLKDAEAGFTRLVEEFPESRFAEQAKTWMDVLGILEKQDQELKKLSAIRNREEQIKNSPAHKYFVQGKKLFAKGDFKGSLEQTRRILEMPDGDPYRDDALFIRGLVYSHYDNPQKDYKKSLESFSRLAEEYPRSSLIEQAKIWTQVLAVIERAKQVDIDIERRKKELTR